MTRSSGGDERSATSAWNNFSIATFNSSTENFRDCSLTLG